MHGPDRREVVGVDEAQPGDRRQHRAVGEERVRGRQRAVQHLHLRWPLSGNVGEPVDTVEECATGAEDLHLATEGTQLGDGRREVEVGGAGADRRTMNGLAQGPEQGREHAEEGEDGQGRQRLDDEAGTEERNDAQSSGQPLDRRGDRHQHTGDERGEELLQSTRRLVLMDRPRGTEIGMGQAPSLRRSHGRAERSGLTQGQHVEREPQDQTNARRRRGRSRWKFMASHRADDVTAARERQQQSRDEHEERRFDHGSTEGRQRQQGDATPVTGPQPPQRRPTSRLAEGWSPWSPSAWILRRGR